MSYIDEIKERVEAVKGKWDCDGFSEGPECVYLDIYPESTRNPAIIKGIESFELADFLMYSREDIAWLLSEVERLGGSNG